MDEQTQLHYAKMLLQRIMDNVQGYETMSEDQMRFKMQVIHDRTQALLESMGIAIENSPD